MMPVPKNQSKWGGGEQSGPQCGGGCPYPVYGLEQRASIFSSVNWASEASLLSTKEAESPHSDCSTLSLGQGLNVP